MQKMHFLKSLKINHETHFSKFGSFKGKKKSKESLRIETGEMISSSLGV